MSTPQPVPSTPALPEKEGKPQPGPKVMLMGDSGAGKTTVLRTLIDAGITPFVFSTEQNSLQVLNSFPKGKYHYKFISPVPADDWDKALDMMTKVNNLSYDLLTKVSDPFKQAHNKLLEVMTTCRNFVSDVDGVSYGDASKWGTDRALVLDSLSGLSDMAFALVVGNKPVRAMPDYQVAQQSLRMLLNICVTIRPTFILIAHLSREKDEITGGTTITASTVGQKLGPDLPRMFSDVIRAKREGTVYKWDTADSQAIVVGRHLATSQNLPADFRPLINEWVKKGGVIAPA